MIPFKSILEVTIKNKKKFSILSNFDTFMDLIVVYCFVTYLTAVESLIGLEGKKITKLNVNKCHLS